MLGGYDNSLNFDKSMTYIYKHFLFNRQEQTKNKELV